MAKDPEKILQADAAAVKAAIAKNQAAAAKRKVANAKIGRAIEQLRRDAKKPDGK